MGLDSGVARCWTCSWDLAGGVAVRALSSSSDVCLRVTGEGSPFCFTASVGSSLSTFDNLADRRGFLVSFASPTEFYTVSVTVLYYCDVMQSQTLPRFSELFSCSGGMSVQPKIDRSCRMSAKGPGHADSTLCGWLVAQPMRM